MGTTSARLAALSFATLTVISIAAILLTFARMIQPGEAETIMGMNVNLWYIFAASSAILSFALFALFTTLDSIRESNERIADVLEDMDVIQPAQATKPAAAQAPTGDAAHSGPMRFRVTGVDRATGMQTSVIVEAKDKAEATLRARDRGVRDLSRVEYIRRSTAESIQQQQQQVPQQSQQRPPAQMPIIQTTPSQQINLASDPGPLSPLTGRAGTSVSRPAEEQPSLPVSQPTSSPTHDG